MKTHRYDVPIVCGGLAAEERDLIGRTAPGDRARLARELAVPG